MDERVRENVEVVVRRVLRGCSFRRAKAALSVHRRHSLASAFATIQPPRHLAATRPRLPRLPRASPTTSLLPPHTKRPVDDTPINTCRPRISLRGRAAHHGSELQPVPAAVRAAPAACADAEPEPTACATLLAALLQPVAERHVTDHGQRYSPRKASAPVAEPNVACAVPVTLRGTVVSHVALRFVSAEHRLSFATAVAREHATPALPPATALPAPEQHGAATAATATTTELYAAAKGALQQGYG